MAAAIQTVSWMDLFYLICLAATQAAVAMTEYILLTVTKESSHPASEYVEDDSMWIVQRKGDIDDWCMAEEFFYVKDVREFKVTKV